MKRILSFILLLGAVHLTAAASPAQSVTDNAPAKVIANTPATGVDNVPITDTDNTPATGVEKAVEYGIVRLSVCNMRRTPDFDAEMVSQALLGTPVHILQTDEGSGWPEIQSPDTYTGWVHKAGIQRMTREEYTAWNAAEKVVVTALTGTTHPVTLLECCTDTTFTERSMHDLNDSMSKDPSGRERDILLRTPFSS